ncbi:MAG: Rieske 2Fe-2S domain-containing protein [Chloroflexi bacterium]|nr:Rieske 2Fe-2S domain-containing protein [Chloroflexota bacterium]
MLSRNDNELLARTGPGSPMGELMRRYWMPALLSDELPEAAGTPIRVRLLGEDLVAFRDSEGRVGLLDESCSHRCTSLAYARNEEGGLRCIYHGWKYDVEGRILETPAEPPESMIRHHLKHRAYPVREAGDVIWTYMGPRDTKPDFPEWEWIGYPQEQRGVAKVFQECNWAQALEGDIDSSHSDYLHSSDIRGRPRDHAPRLETEDTAYGFRYAAIRKPDANVDRVQYLRVTLFVAPFYALIPPQRRGIASWGEAAYEIVNHHAYVPVDDENHLFFTFSINRLGSNRAGSGRDGVPENGYRAPGNRRNVHRQDRAAMKAGNWSGVQGIRAQDRAVTEAMGPVAPRWKEHLGVGDLAVAHFRRRMLDSARALLDGAAPIGLDASIPYRELHSEEKMVPTDWPWQAALDGTPTATATAS